MRNSELKVFLKKIQKNLYFNERVAQFYQTFSDTHPRFTPENLSSAVSYIYRLNKAEKSGVDLKTVSIPSSAKKYALTQYNEKEEEYYKNPIKRPNTDELFAKLKDYDVISFDIFDTALFRKVEYPNDVFKIMGIEMGHNDFLSVRKKAEERARKEKETLKGNREVKLDQIYTVLARDFGIDTKWKQREEELELDLSFANPYIQTVYNLLLKEGKEIIFTSDMYLSLDLIKALLEKNGYQTYEKIYLSNEYEARKGDSSLQRIIAKDYQGKRIIHIGDNKESDVKKTEIAGIDAVYNPLPNLSFRESGMDNLSGSFYRSIINSAINSGYRSEEDLYYDHGFRVGGILTAGFCERINETAKARNIDKILFCARDCFIIHTAYNSFYKECDNEYISISRYAIMNVAVERYLYDLYNRFVLKALRRYGSSKTISAVFEEMGYGYLNDYLSDIDVDRFAYPSSLDLSMIENFFYSHADVIKTHNYSLEKTAASYFKNAIGTAKNILVVDIGWSGTCITALKYFLKEKMQMSDLSISGLLMCTSKAKALTQSLESGEIDSYIYSPFENLDLADYMMQEKTAADELDIRHMPLEYLFTSTEGSLISYTNDTNDQKEFEKAKGNVSNPQEISSMQKGILDFVKLYTENTASYRTYFRISPYVAFNPLFYAIQKRKYIYSVYKNFTYDACTIPYAKANQKQLFSSLFPSNFHASNPVMQNKGGKGRKRILFITPELIYAGAPRSLLRMCKVARDLNYDVEVWSGKDGPFAKEYAANGFSIRIVNETEIQYNKSIHNELRRFDLAICNTIVTDKYEKICSRYIPTIWYIREATNIPDFCNNNYERLLRVKNSKNIYCVSDYASEAIAKFTNHKIRVAKNCVEDEKDLATGYRSGSSGKIKFVQFGLMEYRKGYDVLLAAYKSLPEHYKKQVELYFAGGFINSGLPFCEYLFAEMKNEPNVHYLGLISNETERIQTLSNMDVIVVASRDESCSLVALEGTMLAKPIIVTENVGAKYICHEDNGVIVKTDDVDSLKEAMIFMVDHKNNLQKMGDRSRSYYETQASMEIYRQEMEKLFKKAETKNYPSFIVDKIHSRLTGNRLYTLSQKTFKYLRTRIFIKRNEKVIVSITSYPRRIGTVASCIQSLLNQRTKPEKVLLWLSEEQFPKKDANLPQELLRLQKENSLFEIRWVKEDLGPHKKYFYAAREFPDHPIIVVDDDAIYDSLMVKTLMDSYRNFPNCISCMRANLITFKEDKDPKPYKNWIMGYTVLLDTPSENLLPTGVGGVLYPPHCLPDLAFQTDVIKNTCLYCDDLWLKAMTTYNGYSSVVPSNYCTYELIEGSQDNALWQQNVVGNRNNQALDNILNYLKTIPNGDQVIERIRKNRFK